MAGISQGGFKGLSQKNVRRCLKQSREMAGAEEGVPGAPNPQQFPIMAHGQEQKPPAFLFPFWTNETTLEFLNALRKLNLL